ncbi:MAG: hypothetical protein U0836_16275 [Pirellulales bacterium]
MKLATPCCPECGNPATRLIEHMLTECEIKYDEPTGTFEYTGEYEDDIETVEPVVADDGTVGVECDELHTWRTAIEYAGLPEPKGLALLTAHKMAVRWSYHKQAWVATMLRPDNGREVQFVAVTPAEAIEGAHAKATKAKEAAK